VRPVSHTLLVGTLLLLLTWLLMRGSNPEVQRIEDAFHALDRLAIAQSALQRDVLRARSGLLRNYDPLVAEIAASRDAANMLHWEMGKDETVAQRLNELGETLDEQEDLVERFKSTNALLQNSLTYFGVFSTWLNTYREDHQPASPLVGALAVAVLHLTLDASPAATREVGLLLNYLADQSSPDDGQAATIARLIAHGRMLHRLLPEMDRLLKAMAVVPIEQRRDSVRSAVAVHQRVAETSAQRHRLSLYGVSLALLGVLIAFGARLQRRAQSLRRRAALEHTIARISTRFINATSREMPEHIEGALAELGRQIGADRAYFAMPSASPGKAYSWHREGVNFPQNWLSDALEAAAEAPRLESGIIYIRDITSLPAGMAKDRLSSVGVAAWVCIPPPDGDYEQAMLGFEALKSCSMVVEEVNLLRMAFDIISSALHRQALEAERSRLEEHLQRARRMETIGALTSGIAHNFNNIVGAMLGYAEMAQSQAPEGGRLAASIIGIRRAAERAQGLIEQILTFGRRRELRRVPLTLRSLLIEAQSLLGAALPSRIELRIKEQHGDATVLGEAGQLQNAILNLCTNAAQAMGGSGRITIETDVADRLGGVRLSQGTLPGGTYAIISVEDRGPGMSEATLQRIFEPFFTTRVAGNGLGLATVREVIGDHGGAIHVQSTLGAGTRFEVWLPCCCADEKLPESEPVPAVSFGQGETILIVAEDRKHLLSNEETVAALGYEPIGFINTEAAFAACRETPERFDAALVRQTLSVSAISLASALHETVPGLPILVAASFNDDYEVEALIKAGVFELVRKPFTSEELAGALARCIARSAARPQRALTS
jgi:signal transduction histidine kinase/CheY-like chemotaxis protein